MNPIQAARAAGQQVWLDNLSRSLIQSGELARHIESGVAGVTTNPAIFHKAIAEGPDYRPALDAMNGETLGAAQRYERLVIEDVQRACDAIRPVFDASKGDAGYVSLEVSPALADDEAGTVAAARRLRAAVTACVREGQTTRDLGGALSTGACGDAVLRAIERLPTEASA